MKGPPTLSLFAAHKRRGEKLVLLTAYDLSSARIAREGGVDAIIVGDSLGMVVLGYDTTIPVTLDDMLHHCRAVARARPELPLIADMPYGSFHVTPQAAVRDALRLIKEGGASAVKIEGGREREGVLAALRAAEIPVMGHLGLTPQSVNRFGGYKVQGRGRAAAARLLADARFLEAAGCFALVLECIPAPLGRRITAALGIPTIGIGAGPDCDGQVLVFHDLLGLTEGLYPTFVKRYAELGRLAVDAVRRYGDEVRAGTFPAAEHSFAEAAPATAAAPPTRAGTRAPARGSRRAKG